MVVWVICCLGEDGVIAGNVWLVAMGFGLLG